LKESQKKDSKKKDKGNFLISHSIRNHLQTKLQTLKGKEGCVPFERAAGDYFRRPTLAEGWDGKGVQIRKAREEPLEITGKEALRRPKERDRENWATHMGAATKRKMEEKSKKSAPSR